MEGLQTKGLRACKRLRISLQTMRAQLIRLRGFFSRADHPGGFSNLVQGDHPGDPGDHPGDPGARITAQVLQSDLIRAGAADRLVRIDR